MSEKRPSARLWSAEETQQAIAWHNLNYSNDQIAQLLGRSEEAVRQKLKRVRYGGDKQLDELIPLSRYERYDDPLVMEGDAVVLPDIELPFQDADFFNRVLELADSWGIRKAIVAGDLLHFDSLSTWEANWIEEKGYGLSESTERKLMDMAMDLPQQYQDKVMSAIISLDDVDDSNSGVSKELAAARKSTRVLSQMFDQIDFVLGNHDDRLLRALKSPMFPADILRLIDADEKWRSKPYYYSILVSNGEKYQIEHPKTWAKSSPVKLASKYRCHILQAHSHRWGVDLDISGEYWAINMGCIVDEFRLPYASQRHNTADAHKLGAVIVREGYPYLLGERTPWDKFKAMR